MGDPPRRRSNPLGIPVIEKGPPARDERERLTPRRLPTKPETWDDDCTPPTTDPALYRAVRSLRDDVRSQSGEIAAITTQVAILADRQASTDSALQSIDGKQDEQTKGIAEIGAQVQLLLDDRSQHHALTRTRMIAETTTKESWADKVLTEQIEAGRDKRKLYITIASGVFSVSVLTAIIATLASRC